MRDGNSAREEETEAGLAASRAHGRDSSGSAERKAGETARGGDIVAEVWRFGRIVGERVRGREGVEEREEGGFS